MPDYPRRPLPVSLSAALAAVALIAALPAALAAQDPPPEKGHSKTYYDSFGHGGGEPTQGAPGAAVDLASAPVVRFINAAGGAWNDPANWSGGAVPGEGDHAVIDMDGTYTVTLDADARIAGLTLGAAQGTQTLAMPSHAIALGGPGTVLPTGVLAIAGGTVTGDGDLVVHGKVEWTDGAMSGRGKARIAADGRIDLSGEARKVLSLRHLENEGVLTWSGGNLVVTFASQVVTLAGGRFEVGSGGLLDVYGPAGPAVRNDGTMRVASGGVTTFETPLLNSGTLELEGSSLHLLASFTQTDAGTLRLAVGGAACEAVQVDGQATLAGTVELTWAGDAEPCQVLTYSSREGEPATWNGLTTPSGQALTPRFEESGLTFHPSP